MKIDVNERVVKTISIDLEQDDIAEIIAEHFRIHHNPPMNVNSGDVEFDMGHVLRVYVRKQYDKGN